MINVKFMKDDVINILKNDIKKNDAKKINSLIIENPTNNLWLSAYCKTTPFYDVKYLIDDFEIKTYSENEKLIDLENAKTLYEHLNKLPRYILTDERFWAWLNFDIGYKYALQAMPIKSKSTVGDHFLFNAGNRRGLFFGVLSRLYFWTELTVDNTKDNIYELTEFVINNIERIRNLTWRSNSSEKHIVMGVVKAEKDLFDEYSKIPEQLVKFENAEKLIDGVNMYTDLAKYISFYGSVRLIDAVIEEDIYKVAKDRLKLFIEKRSS